MYDSNMSGHGATSRCVVIVHHGSECSALPLPNLAQRGMTPLHMAAMVGNLGVTRALVEKHGGAACVRMADTRGRTPLHLAAGFGRVDVALYLAPSSDVRAVDVVRGCKVVWHMKSGMHRLMAFLCCCVLAMLEIVTRN
jgi:ankyrin repeat protein